MIRVLELRGHFFVLSGRVFGLMVYLIRMILSGIKMGGCIVVER